MADIELVIKIPEVVYQEIMKNNNANFIKTHYIKDGTPLPKGHSDLIDRDELIEWCESNDDKLMNDYYIKHIESAQTIIEADKESK